MQLNKIIKKSSKIIKKTSSKNHQKSEQRGPTISPSAIMRSPQYIQDIVLTYQQNSIQQKLLNQ